MVGWHHQLDGHEFEQGLGVGDGQGSLVCFSPWGRRESDTTEQLHWTEDKYIFNFLRNCQLVPLGGYTSFLPTISEWKFSAFSIFKNIWHSFYFSMLVFLVYMCKDISCWFQLHSINDDKLYQHFNLLFHLSSIFLNLIPVLPPFFSTKFICSLVKYQQIAYARVCFCTTYSNPLIYFLHWKMYHILLIIVVFTDFKFIKYKYLDFVLYIFP